MFGKDQTMGQMMSLAANLVSFLELTRYNYFMKDVFIFICERV